MGKPSGTVNKEKEWGSSTLDGTILDYIMEDQFIDEDAMDQEGLELIMIPNGTMSFHRSRHIEKKEQQGLIEFL